MGKEGKIEKPKKEYSREQSKDIIKAHLANSLLGILGKSVRNEEWDDRYEELLIDALGGVAENAKSHKITLEEYKQITDSIKERSGVDRIREDMKNKFLNSLEDLKIMIFEQEEEKEE